MSIDTELRARGPLRRPRRYAPGIDGVRALAVLSVFGYHAGIPLLGGGFLGVDVFFVISGFLITDLLAHEQRRTGSIDLRAFWVRRARRLLPALAVMLVTVTAAAVLIDRSQLAGLRGDLLAAATYTSNWHQISAHTSYFAQFGPQPILVHLWSLAVEEQFYVLWPLLLLLLVRTVRLFGRRAAIVLAGALVSTIAMAVAYQPGGDPSRLYYGTDTHAAGLLIGAALALWLGQRGWNGGERRDAVGAGALVALAVILPLASDSGGFVYRGGFLLVAFLAAGVVAAAASDGRVARRLAVGPLRYVGTRSYAIYLWHWPVLCLLHTHRGQYLRVLTALVVTLGLAELSWRLVEDPVRRHGLWNAVREAAEALRPRSAPMPRLVAGGGAIAVALVACIGVALPAPRDGAQAQIEAGERAAAAAPKLPTAGTGAHGSTAGGSSSRGSAGGSSTHGPAGGPTSRESNRSSGGSAKQARSTDPARTATHGPGAGVTAVGDSVMLAAAAQLRAQLPYIQISAKVGRQMSSAERVVASLRASHQLGSVVVVDLGTNGEFTEATLGELMSTIGPARKVVLLTVFAPRSWQGSVNAAVRSAPSRWPNVTVVDWYTAISRQQQLLWPDHVHPRPAGAQLYAKLVTAALPASVR